MNLIRKILELLHIRKKKGGYPKEIAGLCEQARGEAKQKMLNAGLNVGNEPDCKVKLLRGEKQVRRIWTVAHAKGNVGGLFYNNTIEIYHNPANKTDVHYKALVHEFQHYYAANNGYGMGHISKLDWRI